MKMNNKIAGLVFFTFWCLVGWAVSAWTVNLFIPYSIGGVFDPPAIWSLAFDFGWVVLPFLLIFGGAPAAIQMMRGRPWQKVALFAIAICAITWLIIIFLVILGPTIFGWSW